MITEDAVQAYNKQFKQLVGSKILNFKMVQCEFIGLHLECKKVRKYLSLYYHKIQKVTVVVSLS